MTKLYYFQGVWSPTHLNSTSKRFLKINENYKKLRAHVCVHILVMDRPQPLLRTALQFRKFSPASHLDFFSLFFFQKLTVFVVGYRWKKLLYSPCTSFSVLLFSSLAQLATSRWDSSREGLGWAAIFPLPLLGRSQLWEARALGRPGLASQVALLHNPPWMRSLTVDEGTASCMPRPLKRNKMTTLKHVLSLQAASLHPDWVMSPLCWTTTSYQVSHKGSFIKLDSPLVFIALIKEHKKRFFSGFGGAEL